MTAVARALFRARRGLADLWPLWVALACWPLIGLGVLGPHGLRHGSLVAMAASLAFVAAVIRGVAREVWAPPAGRARPREAAWRELELGVLLLTATYVLVAFTGGLRSFMYPLVYALVSFLMVVHRSAPVAATLVLAALALEAMTGLREPARLAKMAEHAVFIGFFAAGNLLVLSSVVRRIRSHHATAFDARMRRLQQEARDFRLIASQLPLESRSRGREEEEARMIEGTVATIHDHLYHTLDLVRGSLGAHTCALLWVDGTRAKDSRGLPQLRLKEVVSDSDLLVPEPELGRTGLLAAVLRDPKPLRLKALRGKRVPPYYDGPEEVTDLCAVPLLDGSALRGVLCADRREDRPFTDEEERLLAQAAEHILRAVDHERVFSAVERGKYEQEQFYRASELLNEALTLDEVYQKTFVALRAIAHFELAAITSYDAHDGLHKVLAAEVAEGADEDWQRLGERLQGLAFTDGPGLVAMAVKNRHFMPASAELHDGQTVVLDADTRLTRARSLLVLPLVRGEQVLGTLLLATERPKQYGPALREMLRVIGHQVGVSLQNARMYQSMEERATTDGLTGLTNHRAFQERLAQLHALAERTGQKFSIILTDIDHFKSINDTYGHPVGDQVLKRVSALFAGRARKVDIVARYGGEEFVLVLPDTDGVGAEHFANKLREEVAAQTMASDHGSFHVTISMGVAEYPADSRDRQQLVELADQALYHCKENGRNCVVRHAALG